MGKFFINFNPTVSDKAKKKIANTMRSWKMQLRSDKTLEDLSSMFHPIMIGWINYYGKYYKTELYLLFKVANRKFAK